MATPFFNFKHNAFVVHPDAKRLFRNRGQQRALQVIAYGIEGRKGLHAIIGARGMGKMTLMRSYIELRKQHNIEMIVMSALDASFRAVLERLCQSCRVPVVDSDRETALRCLQVALTREYDQGKRVVLVIESAGSLTVPILEEMLVLTEMENESGKLLQIFFLAEPEFERQLQRVDSQALKQGIQTWVRLMPFTESESVSYVKYQIANVGLLDEQPFTSGALKRIVRYGKGNPGMLNSICNAVLEQAMRQQRKLITSRLVKEVLSDLEVVEPMLRWGWVVASCVGALTALGLFWGGLSSSALLQWWETAPGPHALAPANDSVPWDSRDFHTLQPPSEAARARAGVSSDDVARRARQEYTQGLSGLGGDKANRGPAQVSQAEDGFPELSTRATVAIEPARENKRVVGADGLLHQSNVADLRVEVSPLTSISLEAKTWVLCLTARQDGKQRRDIVLVDGEGKIQQQLVSNGALNLAPSLSPDGMILAYTSYRGGAPAIYLRNLNKAQDKRLTFRPGFALPGTWASNGRYLVLSKSENSNSDIFLYDHQRHHLRRLTLHSGSDFLPSFASDSYRVVFTSNRTGTLQVYITTINGRSPVRLTKQGQYNTSGIWSPRSDVIAFIGRGADQNLNLYTIRADGTGRRQVTQDGHVVEEAPTWSPDGQSIMYTRTDNGNRQRRVARIDGSSNRELPGHGSTCYAPQWVASRTVH